MKLNGQIHAPATLIPGESTHGTLWIGSWVNPRVGLKAVARRNCP